MAGKQPAAGLVKSAKETEGPHNPFGISVQTYSFQQGSSDPDITPYVVSIDLRLTLTRPWEVCTIMLAVPGTRGVANRNIFEDATYIPGPGDWIVVRSFRAKSKTSGAATIFFGSVRDVEPKVSIGPDGVKDFRMVEIEAVSWLELVGKNEVYVAPQAATTVGTFFARSETTRNFVAKDVRERLRTWDELVSAVLSGVDPQGGPDVLGKSLSKLWVALGAIQVPSGLAAQEFVGRGGGVLTGSYLGDQIPVVYNDPTRKKFAPRMTIEPVPGWSVDGIKSVHPQGESSLDLMLGTYFPDQNMVEFFPTLEPFDQAAPDQGAVSGFTPEASDAFVARQDLEASDVEDAATVGRRSEITFAEDDLSGEGPAKARTSLSKGTAATALGDSLGMNPVLVYRVKPWRPQELEEYISNPNGPIQERERALSRLNTDIFRGVTWHRKDGTKIIHGFSYSEDEIAGWTGRFDNDDHVNFCTVGLLGQANSGIRFLSAVGLPIYATQAIREAGLRRFQPNWPFFPPFDQEKDKSADAPRKLLLNSLFAGLFTVALQGMQFMGAADRFLKGSVTFGDFSPELRPGMSAEFDIRDVFGPGAGIMTAYVDEVSHRVDVNQTNGAITASTTCQYSRGALSASVYTQQFKVQEDL